MAQFIFEISLMYDSVSISNELTIKKEQDKAVNNNKCTNWRLLLAIQIVLLKCFIIRLSLANTRRFKLFYT